MDPTATLSAQSAASILATVGVQDGLLVVVERGMLAVVSNLLECSYVYCILHANCEG
jgi:hypothetical protein